MSQDLSERRANLLSALANNKREQEDLQRHLQELRQALEHHERRQEILLDMIMGGLNRLSPPDTVPLPRLQAAITELIKEGEELYMLTIAELPTLRRREQDVKEQLR